MCATQPVWRSEDNFQELTLSTVWVPGSELRLSAWHLYLLSYLTSPQPDFILIPASLTCYSCVLAAGGGGSNSSRTGSS